MGKIHILPEQVAHKIAAGEIIERPASVVKELIENSIDASATQILIEISASGTGLIRVTDNGCGMESDDAKLAFERHATSKIRQVEDLWAIQTMGFRGEALPSIATVARVTMVTKTQEANAATRIVIEAGQIKEVNEIGSPVGTMVEVRDLFYNTPARLKFLKSEMTEFGHISHIVTQVALVYPEIDFRLRQQGRLVIEAPVIQDPKERIAVLFGRDLTKELIAISEKTLWGKVSGYIAEPTQTRTNRQGEHYFVNRRIVSNRGLSHAVIQGYHTLLPSKRYPVIFLFVEILPQLLDVNIHPAKREIKFQNETQVHDDLVRIIRSAFQKDFLGKPHPRADQILEAIEGYEKKEDRDESILGEMSYESSKEAFTATEISIVNDIGSPYTPPPKVIGQLHHTYIIAEDEQGLVLYDQHTLHERIRYERLVAQFEKSPLESQPLLFPVAVAVSPKEEAIWQEHHAIFQKLGFEIEPFGNQMLRIRSAPAVLNKVDLSQFLTDLLAELVVLESATAVHAIPEEMIKTIACRSSVMAGERLDISQLQPLVDQLRKVKVPQTCPHGRPTTWRVTWEEIEKRFRR